MEYFLERKKGIIEIARFITPIQLRCRVRGERAGWSGEPPGSVVGREVGKRSPNFAGINNRGNTPVSVSIS
ncbi:hypothetical protein AKJ41_02130 [candidate division MSBL1 archaeon SCGC-AAA259O05]|uniref:Uncharacterized protein n=1 Tax=candidate division MSBL1 archaeon SCGC-AAA259O05 TaxID=1698271 RepID=A0A133V4E8_9EURY|nr:hypothetical protein AKJ41_02130 [candidate division MSBL1 archaeon SCGC-AAA259O05]